ncbi:hypothetical protein FD754_006151 [Muntiacus muntjak]|uniref:Peptidase S1 domain-containing protein n=1 Tax=Muntiacus muntjak TaxID=9888 RepID=A0A5N3WMJ6_MUNMU|nr:hypothetical protein FD754_006151 [Muntiacus muntjak]
MAAPLLILLLSFVLGSKIIDGVPCPRGSHPWQVALRKGLIGWLGGQKIKATRTRANNLMLVKLNGWARLSSSVKNVNLPSHCDPPPAPDHMHSQLICTDVKLLSPQDFRKVCKDLLGDSMLCAGILNSSTWRPLMCKDTLQGLVSWGSFLCGQPNDAGVYIQVCKYIDQIKEIIKRYRQSLPTPISPSLCLGTGNSQK